MVSELATKCVRYVKSDITVTIERTPSRCGSGSPTGGRGDLDRIEMKDPAPTEATGRGLRRGSTTRNKMGRRAHGGWRKSVWFTLGFAPT